MVTRSNKQQISLNSDKCGVTGASEVEYMSNGSHLKGGKVGNKGEKANQENTEAETSHETRHAELVVTRCNKRRLSLKGGDDGTAGTPNTEFTASLNQVNVGNVKNLGADANHEHIVSETSYATWDAETIASLHMVINMLHRDLQNAQRVISGLKQENDELKKKQNEDCDEAASFSTVTKKRRAATERNPNLNGNLVNSNRYEMLEIEEEENAVDKEVKSPYQCNSKQNENEKRVLVIGDSLLKFAGEACKEKGYEVRCFPGIKLEELQHKVSEMNLKKENPEIVLIHAGTNNISRGVRAEDIMGETMGLINYIRCKAPNSKIAISGVLRRRDTGIGRIGRINQELDRLCETKKCLMVDGNAWLKDTDFGRDGVHLNRRGSSIFGNLMCNVVSCLLKGN